MLGWSTVMDQNLEVNFFKMLVDRNVHLGEKKYLMPKMAHLPLY